MYHRVIRDSAEEKRTLKMLPIFPVLLLLPLLDNQHCSCLYLTGEAGSHAGHTHTPRTPVSGMEIHLDGDGVWTTRATKQPDSLLKGSS